MTSDPRAKRKRLNRNIVFVRRIQGLEEGQSPLGPTLTRNLRLRDTKNNKYMGKQLFFIGVLGQPPLAPTLTRNLWLRSTINHENQYNQHFVFKKILGLEKGQPELGCEKGAGVGKRGHCGVERRWRGRQRGGNPGPPIS